MTVEMKSYIGHESGHDGDQGVTSGSLELVNVLRGIVVIKYYHKHDSGDYGKQGVTPHIIR
jgi:hypothetical protein